MKIAQYVKFTVPEGTKVWVETGVENPDGNKLADLPEGFWLVFEGKNLTEEMANSIRLESATPAYSHPKVQWADEPLSPKE